MGRASTIAPAPAHDRHVRTDSSDDAQRLLAAALEEPEAALVAAVETAASIAGAPSRVYLGLRDEQVVRWVTLWDESGAHVTNGTASRLGPHLSYGRAILERRTVYHPDVLAVDPDEGFDPAWLSGFVRDFRSRTTLYVPLVRGERAAGVVAWHGPYLPDFRPFAPAEVARLEAWAEDVAPSVEAAWRLYRQQVQDAQQRAAAGILRNAGGAGASVERVFRAVAEQAVQTCGAAEVALWLAEDGRLRAHAAFVGGEIAPVPDGDLPLDRTTIPGRACADRRFYHARDLPARLMGFVGTEEPFDDAWIDGGPVARGLRSYVAVPLLRDDAAMGVLTVASTVPNALNRHRPTIETLAQQAAVALETARLFAALEESNRALQESLEQQTATAEVLRVIAANPADVRGVMASIADALARLCGADEARVICIGGPRVIWHEGILRPSGQRISIEYERRDDGPIESWARTGRDYGLPHRARRERRAVQVADLAALREENAYDGLAPDWVRAVRDQEGYRAVLATPLQRGDTLVGNLEVKRRDPYAFSDREVALAQTFADQAVIAMENARLFSELQERLEEQTATAEVLRVISESPTDMQRVFDAICVAAARLCGTEDAGIMRIEGDLLRRVAWWGTIPMPEAGGAISIAAGSLNGQAVLERRTVHVPDVLLLPEDGYAVTKRFYSELGNRAALVAPLLRGGEPVGTLMVRRMEPGPFAERQIALLQTFADQAVIAIENVRLIQELRERDDRRAKELERASAIQQRLLPAEVQGWPGVLEIAVRFRPAVETSGDFYDMVRLAPAEEGALPPLQIAVGDVAGKGMSAALVTALARTALRTTTSVPVELATPASTLRLAGRRLHADVGSGHFVACALAVLEPPGLHHKGPRLRLSNAAQVPVLLCRGGRGEEVAPPGYRLPLGAQPDGDYQDAVVELRPGDAVVFASDGLPEAPAQASANLPHGAPLAPPGQPGELFGFERLAQSAAHWSRVGESAEAVAEGIWQDVTAWAGEESHHDDMTLLVLRVPEGQR